MKKVLVTIMLGIALLTTASCGSKEPKTETSSGQVSEAPTVTTTDTMAALEAALETEDFATIEAALDAECDATMDRTIEQLERDAEMLPKLPYADKEVAELYLTTSNEGIRLSIRGIQSCTDYLPDGEKLLESLYEIQENNDAILASL